MLLCGGRRFNILAPTLPLSFETFIKHLAASKSSKLSLTTTSFTASASASANSKVFSSSCFEALNSRQKEQVHIYIDSLLEWNQKMNLTAVKEESEVMERHVEDSLSIIEPIRTSYLSHCGPSSENLNLVDVGSGAGLPGIILAIASPGWKVTLLESMNKRCSFLEHVVSQIGLSNVQVERERAEKLGQDVSFRESFDVAVARAVAEMRILAEYCLPLVRTGGIFVASKGHDPQEEVHRAERAIQLMGASLLQIRCDGFLFKEGNLFRLPVIVGIPDPLYLFLRITIFEVQA
ncbi:ribosomal RNA small subunit methyltransferase G isoform X2 [Capsicum annuum]|uniref:ribosomal RNA small subunit methyltransferase G isoform X2 n=1 Tax=Capsicum annuum TaxID=4072 RepID=UPI001FB0856A|nr:ribosomal RNA small subunit methyltransferase G isoform X2 [Capsicum annuum]